MCRKDPRDPLTSTGVYGIPCSCGLVYIGTTKRSINTSLKEHKRNCRLGQADKSAVAEHAPQDGDHNINFANTEVLSTVSHYHTRENKTDGARTCGPHSAMKGVLEKLKTCPTHAGIYDFMEKGVLFHVADSELEVGQTILIGDAKCVVRFRDEGMVRIKSTVVENVSGVCRSFGIKFCSTLVRRIHSEILMLVKFPPVK
ncbi:hypothetical protein Trydic_g3656 [Trypoxylus dichotomus]